MLATVPLRSLLFLSLAACSQLSSSAGMTEDLAKQGVDAGLGCQRSEKKELESIYIAPLSPNEAPFTAEQACAVTQGGIANAGAAVLSAASERPALPFKPWDHKTTPARLSLIERRFALSAAERAALMRDGLVIPERLSDSDYVMALHEVYQSQLPLYVSVDAIAHAIYASSDKLLAQLEATLLAPRLDRLLEALHCALPAATGRFPETVTRDVDLYLTVARSLLADKAVASLYAQDAEVKLLFDKAKAAGELAPHLLFGRARMIDFSLYRPRGHYAAEVSAQNPNHADLSAYFRAAMWLSRLEFNILSRSCTSSHRGPEIFATPREAAVAVALGRLAATAKLEGEINALDRAWGLLAGKREDVPLPKLAEIAAAAGVQSLDDPQLTEKLRTAIGRGYPRSARTHYVWQGCPEQPVIATLLGPRIVADAAATRPLVHSETPQRRMLHAADMGYALGHEQALKYLAADLGQYPALRANLDRARKLMHETRGEDLYSKWSTAIQGLAAAAPAGAVLPSFMRGAAFADLRLNSAVAALGQMRHNYVLMAAQTYDEGGCDIPDAFVEPAPAFYDALIDYAERGAAVLRELDPEDAAGSRAYFMRLGGTLRILAKIGRDELAGRALSADEKRFLAMVVEATGTGRGTGGSPTFTGWYFDLFRDRRDAFSGAGFIADYYTSTELGQVAYAGVAGVRLGIFVVDTAGAPRALIGPVARAFEYVGPLDRRLTDAEGMQLPEAQRASPWATSYTLAAPTEPPLTYIATVQGSADDKRTQEVTLAVFSTRALGPVTIELLDHHRLPLGRVTHPVGVTKTKFYFPARPIPKGSEHFGYEGVHVHVGAFDAWDLDVLPDPQAGAPRVAIVTGSGRAYGGMPAVPPVPEPQLQE